MVISEVILTAEVLHGGRIVAVLTTVYATGFRCTYKQGIRVLC